MTALSTHPRLLVHELGRRPYAEVLELQRSLCRARVERQHDEDILLLVEHDPVYTLGRSTRESSLPLAPALLRARGAEVFEIERGGDVTFHGPGQLVGYPIIDLARHRQDLHWYLRELEGVLIDALDVLGVAADRNPGKTGVWTGGRKIASIGVHVKQWVTLHGFALNVTTDLAWFDWIVPCGIADVQMTSVGRESDTTGNSLADIGLRARDAVVEAFGRRFSLQPDSAKLPAL